MKFRLLMVIAACVALPAALSAQSYEFTASDGVLKYNNSTGESLEGDVTLSILEFPPQFTPTAGFTMNVLNDLSVVPASAELSDTMQGLNGGAGPDIAIIQQTATGTSISVIYDQLLTPSVIFVSNIDVATINYDIAPILVGSGVEFTTPIAFINSGQAQNTVILGPGSFVTPTTLNSGNLLVGPTALTYIRGDANGDGTVNWIADVTFILNTLTGGPVPPCLRAADANGDGAFIATADAIYLMNAFLGTGPVPPAPFPDCDEVDSPLTCAQATCP